MRSLLFLLLFFSMVACKVNQLTGKKTFNAYSNKQLFPTAFSQYGTFLKENTVIKNTAESNQITAIGKKISAAAQQYFSYKGAPEPEGLCMGLQFGKRRATECLVHAWWKNCGIYWFT